MAVLHGIRLHSVFLCRFVQAVQEFRRIPISQFRLQDVQQVRIPPSLPLLYQQPVFNQFPESRNRLFIGDVQGGRGFLTGVDQVNLAVIIDPAVFLGQGEPVEKQ